MYFTQPNNIIFFEKFKKIIFSVLNDNKHFYVLKNKKKYKIKKFYKDSKIIKIDDNSFIEYAVDKNYFSIRNLINNRKKKIILKKNFCIKQILLNLNHVCISGIINNKSYLFDLSNKNYLKLNFDVSIYSSCFFNKKLFLADKKNSKIFTYNFNKKKLIYKFGNYGSDKILNFRNINFLTSNENFLGVNDRDNYKIKLFDKNLNFYNEYGGKGLSSKSLDFAESFYLTKNSLYIADTNNDRIVEIDKKNKSNVLIQSKLKEGFFRRPMKSIIYKKKIIILDRENKCIQFFDRNKKFLTLIKVSKKNNSKPNSFCKISYKDKDYFIVLCRTGQKSNYLEFYNNDFNFLYSKKINTKDAQDIEGQKNYFWIADTLNRKIKIFNFDLKLIKNISIDKIAKNKKILVKSISYSVNYMVLADFEKCNIYFFDHQGNLKKVVYLDKYQKQLGAIRFVNIINNQLIILSRSNKPIWSYNLKSYKIKKYFDYGVGNKKFYNPASLTVYKNQYIIADKENNQVKFIDKNFKIKGFLPK